MASNGIRGNCPHCGSLVKVLSDIPTGTPFSDTYTVERVPMHVAMDLHGSLFSCPSCEGEIAMTVPAMTSVTFVPVGSRHG